MNGLVYFSEIKTEIISCLRKARKEIKVALAWLTDEDLIRVLTQQRGNGVNVEITISDAQENFRNTEKFREFLQLGGAMYISLRPFMHHKFCIIDGHTILNGSYNWSYPARSNEENITILRMDLQDESDSLFFKRFVIKYDYLKNKCSQQVSSIAELNGFRDTSKDYAVVLKRYDESEIQLRIEFENDVLESIRRSKMEAGISISERMLDRMKSDGGGVEFVKRILHEEMASGNMKSGFDRLELLIPHRVDLSLEYLVARPKYSDLFTDQEKLFCIALMKKYNL